jgi:DNA-binding phage protein
MALTRDYKKTISERLERDPAFAKALLDEAATLFLSNEPETARLILQDLANAALGFEHFAKPTDMPSKSLHRMLSPRGNPAWTIRLPSLPLSAVALRWGCGFGR